MVEGGVPQSILWLSILIIVYSFICLTASTVLMISLLILGERFKYITLISIAVNIGTIASITQQIHYAVAWVDIKDAEYAKTLLSPSQPSLAIGGAVKTLDVVLFYIQFYTYNMEGLLVLFWAGALFKSTWNLQINWLSRWQRHLDISSKIFGVVVPAILVGVINIAAVKSHTLLLFALSNCLLLTTPVIGSVLLILILFKYLTTRNRTAQPSAKHSWWTLLSLRSLKSSSISSNNPLNSNEGFARIENETLHSRSLVIRFSIGFIVLIGFEIATIAFNIVQATHNTNLTTSPISGPDFSIRTTISDLVEFIPGVTISLAIFLVFGTAKRFFPIYKCLFMCRSPRHAATQKPSDRGQRSRRPVIRHLGTVTKVESDLDVRSTNNRIRNFSRLVPKPLDMSLKDKKTRLASITIGQKSFKGVKGSARAVETKEIDLNKPLPHTPSAKSITIGLVVRKSAWEVRDDNIEDGEEQRGNMHRKDEEA